MATTIELKPQAIPRPPWTRFSSTDVYYDETSKQYFYGLWEPPTINSSSNDLVYQIDTAFSYRPDLISQYFFNNPFLGWAICYYNNIFDPFDESEGLYPKRIINIPTIDNINLAK